MANRNLAVAAVLAALSSAGCLSDGGPLVETDEIPPPDYVGPWPALEAASIRPGVRVFSPLANGSMTQCTSNFLFRTPDNSSLFLGLAGHCFGWGDGIAKLGTSVSVAGIPDAGTLVYNSWAAGEQYASDFALVRLSNADEVRSRVHPAVMTWGGPTGLRDLSEVLPGQQVVSYGHSLRRNSDDRDNAREGHVYLFDEGVAVVMTNHPGIPGDSGSGLMDMDGRAIGVLSRGGEVDPADQWGPRECPSINLYTDLFHDLERARRNDANLTSLEIVTWSLLQRPALPVSLPGPIPPIPT